MMPFVLAAAACGVALGLTVALIWNAVNLRFRDAAFWPAVAEFTRSAISGASDADFLRQYANLLKHLASYVGRNLVTVGLAVLPVALFMIVAWPIAHDYSIRHAERVVLFPSRPLTVEICGQSLSLEPPTDSIPMPADHMVPIEIGINGDVLRCSTLTQNWAFSSSPLTRWLLSTLDFTIDESPNSTPLLIVRPSGGDVNPMWPYLNDLEFAFFTALSLTSLAAILASKLRRR